MVDILAKENDSKRPDRLDERMIKSRTLLISSEVSSELVDRVIKNLVVMEEEDPKKLVTVFINSPGGGADSGFAIYDMLRYVKTPIRTICSGMCASAGIVIFLGGDKGNRFSLPNSRFMLHEPRYMSTAYGKASDIAIMAQELLKLKDRYNQVVSEACGKPIDEIADDSQRDFWLSPTEALKYGIVDKIISSGEDIK
jgi:ATP-dependent Clp protease, protease subunit